MVLKAKIGVLHLFLLVVLVIAASLRMMPRTLASLAPASPRPWDIPFRVVTATAIVVALTTVAPVLGPAISGILATFPVYAATLATFGHQLEGWQSAVQVLQGLLYGLFSFATFFLAIGILMSRASIATSFSASTALCFVVQTAALCAMRHAATHF